MTIEILTTTTINDENGDPVSRHTEIIVSDVSNAYLWGVGGLPLPPANLQTILEARESELFAAAAAVGLSPDPYEVTTKQVIKAVALVAMDEFNILRALHSLADRTPAQIQTAVKNRLKTL